jgi:hypothetical protein
VQAFVGIVSRLETPQDGQVMVEENSIYTLLRGK